MMEKRDFSELFHFQKEPVNITEAYFGNDAYNGERLLYKIIFVIHNIIVITALILFYNLRDSYIIRQRNFLLTFSGGVITYINTIFSFLSVIAQKTIPCAISIYTTNVLNILAMQYFISRSLRVILSYFFNIYKVTSLKNKRMKELYYGEKEPNRYLPKIYKKIKLIIILVIVIPTLVALGIEIYMHIRLENDHKNDEPQCTLHTFNEDSVVGMRGGNKYKNVPMANNNKNIIQAIGGFNEFSNQVIGGSNKFTRQIIGGSNEFTNQTNGGSDKFTNQTNGGSDNSINQTNGGSDKSTNQTNGGSDQTKGSQRKKWNIGHLYKLIKWFNVAYVVICLSIALAMLKVKDANKYGVKFECLSTSIIGFINCSINFFFEYTIKDSNYESRGKKIIRSFTYIYTATNGGKFLYILTPIYILFASIILPLIHYRRSKKEKNKYFQEPLSSIQYFYKVLNTPALINELRDIAIKEFNVENVLFWENYQLLQKMVYRYQIEYARAQAMNDEKYIAQYDFEGYYQQQLMSPQGTSSMDSYSYDPNMLIPRQIMPYFTSFYYTFIHYEGPASVNLSSSTITQIQNDISTYPTVGIFDNAKNEVVEMMYTSIFPILLKYNKRHFELSLCY